MHVFTKDKIRFKCLEQLWLLLTDIILPWLLMLQYCCYCSTYPTLLFQCCYVCCNAFVLQYCKWHCNTFCCIVLLYLVAMHFLDRFSHSNTFFWDLIGLFLYLFQ